MKRLLLIGLLCAACGSDADVRGNYTVALTNRDNGCNLAGWTVGAQTTGVQVSVTQAESDVTLSVEGLAGISVGALLGTNVYTGEVSGNEVDVSVLGTVALTSGNCAYTVNSTISGELDGNALGGRVEFRAATTDSPDCAELSGCVSVQEFSGSRPPR